ncbi:hypothetical protein [Edaphobacillus lindanitolerans]|uniref:Uncharacterized protein n=1 Tax=Edaphobacillus lindanitolerans TaxID=550447 RepID=A0A1U7PQF2_9BACI|nr:hypothetical protein [Edaphobacillus lindanitolerans]SIT91210.1 hypothetical protein SAMN05428946_2624 [Edaphobacillus lindanitolerans]
MISLDRDTSRLIDEVNAGKVSRESLAAYSWTPQESERLARYFVLARSQFNSVKKIIQFVSGCIILSESASLGGGREVFHSLSAAKDLLDKADEETRSLPVPAGVSRHHQHLLDALSCLREIFRRFVLTEQVLHLKRDQSDQLLYLLKMANESLKSASNFELGLDMVELNSSCACGH